MSETDPAKPRPRGLVSFWRVLSLLLLVAVFYVVGKQLGRDFKELKARQIQVELNWIYIAAGLVCLLGARFCNAVNTWLLLRSMGVRLPMWRVVSVIWVSSLGRYIPGKVAVVAGSMTMLVRMGARFSVAGAALILSTGIMILIGMLGAIPLFFSPALREALPSARVFVLTLAVMLVTCSFPPIFLAICNFGLRLLHREPIPANVRPGPFWGAVGVGVIRILCVSLALWLAARSISTIGLKTFPHVMGAASLASVIGFVAIFAPAGLGVHEAVYLVALKPLIGAPVAILAILFRGMQVLLDLVVAGIGLLIMRRAGGQECPPSSLDPALTVGATQNG